ncbi:hypothetical protein J6590_060844 [Homalodisca vitripennis]|nr:hypothetical protein J6590_060844 [Homalodisca vitripennis]
MGLVQTLEAHYKQQSFGQMSFNSHTASGHQALRYTEYLLAIKSKMSWVSRGSGCFLQTLCNYGLQFTFHLLQRLVSDTVSDLTPEIQSHVHLKRSKESRRREAQNETVTSDQAVIHRIPITTDIECKEKSFEVEGSSGVDKTSESGKWSSAKESHNFTTRCIIHILSLSSLDTWLTEARLLILVTTKLGDLRYYGKSTSEDCDYVKTVVLYIPQY